jgi:putative transposase
VILTPIRAPTASAFAERVVKTVRTEILDWTLIVSRKHLDRVLATYVSHYTAERPHRGLELAVPDKPCRVAPVEEVPAIGRRDLFDGLIKEYRAVAA